MATWEVQKDDNIWTIAERSLGMQNPGAPITTEQVANEMLRIISLNMPKLKVQKMPGTPGPADLIYSGLVLDLGGPPSPGEAAKNGKPSKPPFPEQDNGASGAVPGTQGQIPWTDIPQDGGQGPVNIGGYAPNSPGPNGPQVQVNPNTPRGPGLPEQRWWQQGGNPGGGGSSGYGQNHSWGGGIGSGVDRTPSKGLPDQRWWQRKPDSAYTPNPNVRGSGYGQNHSWGGGIGNPQARGGSSQPSGMPPGYSVSGGQLYGPGGRQVTREPGAR